jgi:hypothetical protein
MQTQNLSPRDEQQAVLESIVVRPMSKRVIDTVRRGGMEDFRDNFAQRLPSEEETDGHKRSVRGREDVMYSGRSKGVTRRDNHIEPGNRRRQHSIEDGCNSLQQTKRV